jgi:hypothetical protein
MKKEKIFIYTCSDFSEKALECSVMLFDSIKAHNEPEEFVFSIICTDFPKKEIGRDIEIIVDDSSNGYPGWLKYSKKIPKNFNRYLYLDSDILCFENVNKLFEDGYDFSVLYEDCYMNPDSTWHFFPHCSEEEKLEMSKIHCINAGHFCFSNTSFIDTLNKLRHKYALDQNSIREQARTEQSLFNYVMFLQSKEKKIKDITSFIEQGARTNITDKKIYHFFGFEGNMINKFSWMENFYYRYTEKKWTETN